MNCDIYIYIYTRIYIYIYTQLYVYMYIYIHNYMYIYILHMHDHACIYNAQVFETKPASATSAGAAHSKKDLFLQRKVPFGNIIAIESGHRNSEFSHQKR